MEALAKDGFKYQLITVDVAKWGSPVAEQYELSSLPSFVILDKSRKEVSRGQAARQYIYELVGK